MSTFEQDDSLVIELENGVDLRDMSERRGSEDPTSELYKGEWVEGPGYFTLFAKEGPMPPLGMPIFPKMDIRLLFGKLKK